MIKVFYDKRQTARSNESFSPSAGKPEKVVEFWQRQGQPIEIVGFDPVEPADLMMVHEPEYVLKVLSGMRDNGFGNRSMEVAESLPWVAGSMVNAALYAFQNKEGSFSPTSGAHHACFSGGGGYCTFNHLVLAAVKAHAAGAKKVGIIDLDCHYGNGTQDIIDHLGLDFIAHYSFGKRSPSKGRSAEEWLLSLPEVLGGQMSDCDLLIYNAGVDPHVSDPLGGILTSEELFQRDFTVYVFAREFKIPVVTSLAGGYQRDGAGSIEPVLRLHNQTMSAYAEVFGKGKATKATGNDIKSYLEAQTILPFNSTSMQGEMELGFGHRAIVFLDVDAIRIELYFTEDIEGGVRDLERIFPKKVHTRSDSMENLSDERQEELKNWLEGTGFRIDGSEWQDETLVFYVSQKLCVRTEADLCKILCLFHAFGK